MPMAWLLHLPSPAMPIVQEQAHGKEVPCQLVFLLALFLGLYVGAELGLAGWILSYATTLKLADAAEGAYLTAAFWGAFTFGRLLGIPLATRLQPQYILLGDLIGCVWSG